MFIALGVHFCFSVFHFLRNQSTSYSPFFPLLLHHLTLTYTPTVHIHSIYIWIIIYNPFNHRDGILGFPAFSSSVFTLRIPIFTFFLDHPSNGAQEWLVCLPPCWQWHRHLSTHCRTTARVICSRVNLLPYFIKGYTPFISLCWIPRAQLIPLCCWPLITPSPLNFTQMPQQMNQNVLCYLCCGRYDLLISLLLPHY